MVRKQLYSSHENENSHQENVSGSVKKDKKSKKDQKEKPILQKEKIIKKTKNVGKFTDKKMQKVEEVQSNIANVNLMREEVYDSQGEFELSQFNDYVPPAQNQNSLSEQSLSQSQLSNSQQNQLSVDNHSEILESILMILMEFFNSIDQQNGLVFKAQLRKKLKKRFPQINFTDEPDLQPNGKQLQKIKQLVPSKLFIFDKKYHNFQKSDEQFQQYLLQDIEKIISVFQQASYIFCQEVTHQLYDILKKLCNIVVMYQNESEQTLIMNLRKFGDKIASQKDKQHKYFFFGYQFVTFPQNATDGEIKLMQGKEKYKYALKNKYRQEGKQFAEFATKAGLYLQRVIRQLNCYQTLN